MLLTKLYQRWLIAGLCFVIAMSGLTIQPSASRAEASISTYALPSLYSPSSVYSLKAGGVEVPVVSYTGDYDYAHFSMSSGTVTLEVTALGQSEISSYSISPQKLGLAGTVSGNKLTFTIPNDEYLIVRLNDSRALVIAADPMETDKPAASGTGIYNVTHAPYLADATGASKATASIQRAIDDAAAYAGGQGIVYVPAGIYLIGNLELKSDVALYLEGGAVLRFTGVKSDYTVHWYKDSQKRDITWWLHTSVGADNVKIYGRGTIDGNGKYSTTTHNFANNILVPMAATNFTLDGPIVRDSGSWAITPARSNDLTFRNFKMFNRLDMGENDGIDINESQNVVVQHAIGIGLDDPFTTKTWDQTVDISRSWPGTPEPVKNVVFDDLISWTVCYGFKVGMGVLQPQDGVVFKNSVVYDASVGIGINHGAGTPAASNIVFDNIDIERLSYTNDSRRTWLAFFVKDATQVGGGPITGVTVKNIRIRDKGTTLSQIKGMSSSSSISDLTFENIYMPGSTSPATNLAQMNIVDKEFYQGVKILPVQSPEPIARPNLALNKSGAASTALGPIPAAFDGNYSTRWGSARTDAEWLSVDLGASTVIDGVKLVWEAAYGKSYDIQVSEDAASWRTVYSTTTGAGGVEEINFTPTAARYVRMNGIQRGSIYGYSIWEFEVYGQTDGDGSPADPNIRYVGRWDRSRGTQADSSWAGAYFKVNFTGTTAMLKLANTAEQPVSFYAEIDGGAPKLFSNASGTVNLTPTALSPGEHSLRITARDVTDVIRFMGLALDAGAATKSPSVGEGLIEFIGDSITVGYKNNQVALSSYAWKAAELLGAEHTQIAYTGICLQDQVACYSPNAIGMSRQYFKTQTVDYPDSPNWNFATYQPSKVVVNLGTNDYVFRISDSDFQSTYISFLQSIRAKYPQADIYVLRPFGGYKADPAQAAVLARSHAGDSRIQYVDTTGWLSSSDYVDGTHPTENGHTKAAQLLVQRLKPKSSNLAKDAVISGSSTIENSNFGYSRVHDGQRSSVTGSYGWSSNSSLTTNHTEFLTLDLKSSKNVAKVDLYPRSDAGNVGQNFPIDFTIQTSADNVNWTTQVKKTGYAQPDQRVQSFAFPAAAARYIRIEGTNLRPNPGDGGRYRMAFAEVEIYEGNLTSGAKVTGSSSVENTNWSYSRVVDGTLDSVSGSMGWTSNNSLTTNHTEFLQLDLGISRVLSEADLYPRNDAGNVGQNFPMDFTIETSEDQVHWTTVVTKIGYPQPGNTVQSFPFPAITARYVKVTGTKLRPNPTDGNRYRMAFAEVELQEAGPLAGPQTTDNAPEGWSNQAVSVTLTPTDPQSVVAATYYQLNGGEVRSGTNVQVSTDGVNELSYWSVNRVGVAETKRTAVIKLDKRPPVTEAALTPVNGSNGWYVSDPVAVLSASDSLSTVTRTVYRLNGGDWIDYRGPIVVTSEGTNVLQYRSSDQAGNVEETKSVTLLVDKTAPTLQLQLDRSSVWPPNHKLVPVQALLRANDSVSGMGELRLVSITSNEPDRSTEEGDEPNDIQGADIGTNDTQFLLRAERLGSGTGRVYAITYQAADLAGHITTVTVHFEVPHDQR
jgi:hypothetical protein